MNKAQTDENKYRFTIRIGILAVFSSIFLLISIFILSLISWRFYNNAINLTHRVTQALSVSVVKEVTNQLQPAKLSSELTAKLISGETLDVNSVAQIMDYTKELLESVPQAQMAYFGDEKGNFVISRREADETISSEIIARKKKPVRFYLYRDESGRFVKRVEKFKFDYDPRKRPWYISAKKLLKSNWSNPYIFYTGAESNTLGITRATPVMVNKKFVGVVGVDITLSRIAEFLSRFQVSKNGLAFIADEKGHIIAFPGERGTLEDISSASNHWAKYAFFHFLKNPKQTNFNYDFEGEKYQSSIYTVPGFDLQEWLIFIIIPNNDIVGPILHANLITLGLCVLCLLAGLAIVTALSERITRPIKSLTSDLERIKEFNLDTDIVIESRIREVHHMGRVIQAMKVGLKSFQRYIPEVLVRKLIQSGEAAKIGGRARQITTLFSDIENFTTVSESISDEEIMTQMCEYFDLISKIVVDNEGTIDKYIGDSLMAFWGAPDKDNEQIVHACRCVLLAQNALMQHNELWRQAGKETFRTRFGLNTGEAIVGNLGSSNRLNYTAIGDNVNLASRLEQINKTYGTYILVSHSVYEGAKDQFIFRVLDKISVKGQVKSHYIYELIDFKTADAVERHKDFVERFENAMAAYQAQRWDDALKSYQDILTLYPEDKTAQLFVERCQYFMNNPVDKDWNGVWVYTTK